MFVTLTAYNGQVMEVQSRHVSAISASREQEDMEPSQVTLWLQTGTTIEEFLFIGSLEEAKEKLGSGW